MIYCRNQNVKVLLLLSIKGAASIHLEKGHTATTKVYSPSTPGGSKRVIKSKLHNLKGALPFQVGLMNGQNPNFAASTYEALRL